MISSDVIRGYIDIMILSILLEGDSYGYAISRDISRITEGKYSIKETTLYSAFARMEKNKLISSYMSEGNTGKKRTNYRLSDAGREYYQNKCDEWVLTQEIINLFIRSTDSNGNN